MAQQNVTLATQCCLAIILLSIMMLAGILTARVLQAGSIATALYRVDVHVTNSGTSDLEDLQAPFKFSLAALISGNYIAADALNSHIHQGTADVPHMPPTGRIQVEGAIQEDGGVFTEYTAAAQNTTTNDLPLLPAVPAVGDAWYFGCDNPCRIITHEIDTAGAGTWTITYEYWNDTAWTALTNVDDRTTGFTAEGQREVSWDMPANWATRTTTGSSVNSYWGRARVSAFTSVSTQPLGTRQRYENGQWWTWIESLGKDEREQFSLYLGGSSNLQVSHQTFPGTTGIITGDAAGLELGSSYSLGLEGRLDFAATNLPCILCKTGAVTVTVTGTATAPAIAVELRGAGTTNASVPATGSATGKHIVITAADGTAAVTWVGLSDGVGNMKNYTPQTITNTANNLSWANNGGVDYFEWIRLDSATATVFVIDLTQAQFAEGILDGTESFTNGLGLSGN